MNIEQEALKALKDVVDKYNLTIGFSCDGDTHGIYNEECYVNMGNKTIACTSHSYYLDKRDLV